MATLVINRSESRCHNCSLGRRLDGAVPYENGHYTVAGYSDDVRGQPGCGEPWTAVTSDYAGGAFDNIEEHYFGFENLKGLPVVGPRYA